MRTTAEQRAYAETQRDQVFIPAKGRGSPFRLRDILADLDDAIREKHNAEQETLDVILSHTNAENERQRDTSGGVGHARK